MNERMAGLKRGYYLLNTDGGMASGHGRRRSGDPLGHAAISAVLRTPRLVTVATNRDGAGDDTPYELVIRSEAGAEDLLRELGALAELEEAILGHCEAKPGRAPYKPGVQEASRSPRLGL